MKSKIGIMRFGTLIIITCLSICFLTGYFFQSCSLFNFNDNFDYKLDIPEKFTEIGKLHNEGLEYIFSVIKEKQLAIVEGSSDELKSGREIDFHDLVLHATLDFCEKKRVDSRCFKEIESIFMKASVPLKNAQEETQNIQNVNSGQRLLLDKIDTLMRKEYSKMTVSNFKNELNRINLAASFELENSEADVIYCATGTALATYQYWRKNIKKWYFALNYPTILQKYKDDELNKLQIKNEKLILKSGGKDKSWLQSTWTSAEEWWENTSDDLSIWWEDEGKDIADADVIGAVNGAAISIFSAGTLSAPIIGTCALGNSAGIALNIFLHKL